MHPCIPWLCLCLQYLLDIIQQHITGTTTRLVETLFLAGPTCLPGGLSLLLLVP